MTRRAVLKGGAALGAVLVLPGCGKGRPAVAGWAGDGFSTAQGYVHDLVLRWGDPLFPDTPPLDAAAAMRGGLLDVAPGVAGRWFGYNCDGVHFLGTA